MFSSELILEDKQITKATVSMVALVAEDSGCREIKGSNLVGQQDHGVEGIVPTPRGVLSNHLQG